MNKTKQEIITDEEITNAWGYANFGNTPKREIIIDTIKKIAQGWATGHTAMCIAKELGLTDVRNNQIAISDKALEYLLAPDRSLPSGVTEQQLEEMAEKHCPIFSSTSEDALWQNGFISGFKASAPVSEWVSVEDGEP